LNHFDIVRHSGFETVASLIHFFFRKLHAQIRHLHFVAPRFEVQQRGLHIQRNLVAQIRTLLFQPPNLQVRPNNLRVNSPAGEKRQVHARFVRVRRERGVPGRPEVRKIPVKTHGRQPRILRSFFLVFGRLNL
jgi:hypothetical protein